MSSTTTLREHLLFCLGNPLLDITAKGDEAFLKKYGLKANDAILADEKHVIMFEEMLENYNVDYSAGGSVQNGARVCQWIVKIPNVVTYTGCVGIDKFGDILTEISKKAGVDVRYMKHPSEATGKCAVILTGTNRSLCAYLAAANHFQKEHLEKPEMQALIEEAAFFYIEGYHLTVSPDSILLLADHAYDKNKIFSMNLSAPFLITVFKEPMMKVLPFVDVLIGNETEAMTFATEHGMNVEKMEDIAMRLSQLPKQNEARSRTVVITQGKDPVIVVHEGKVSEYVVPIIPLDKVVDTNGAGDGFAGGFLAMFIQGKPIHVCVQCGIFAAIEIIKRDGCTFPEKCHFKE